MCIFRNKLFMVALICPSHEVYFEEWRQAKNWAKSVLQIKHAIFLILYLAAYYKIINTSEGMTCTLEKYAQHRI